MDGQNHLGSSSRLFIELLQFLMSPERIRMKISCRRRIGLEVMVSVSAAYKQSSVPVVFSLSDMRRDVLYV